MLPILYFAATADGNTAETAVAVMAATTFAIWLLDWLLSAYWYPRGTYLILAAILGSTLGQQAIANLLLPQVAGDQPGSYVFGVLVSYFAVSLLAFAIRGWWRNTIGKRSSLDV